MVSGLRALTEQLRAPVVDAAGVGVGRLVDLAVDLREPYPPVTAIRVRTGRARTRDVPIALVESLSPSSVRLGCPTAQLPDTTLSGDELLLARHVLDTQIFDIAGRRLTRVDDVELADGEGGALRLAGVDVGAGALLRRLGLRRLARRLPSRLVDWRSLQLTAGRGYGLHLASEAGGVHRLSAAELAELVSRLPVARGAETLGAVTVTHAADALAAAAPSMSGRLVGALAPSGAAPIVTAMPLDDAVAALRHLDRTALEGLLTAIPSERAGELRRLLAYPPRTAAGLMSPEVCTAAVGEAAAAVRARVVARPSKVEALATVFVVDERGRPQGVIHPTALLSGNVEPAPVPILHASTPVDEVVDLFALTDALALPVVDDAGCLIGAVGVDDVLEELLLERLPGRRRFGFRTLRRHAPA